MPDLSMLRRRVESLFPDIVSSTALVGNKLRAELTDGSYIDFWWSTQYPDRYAYHWERTHIDGAIYRHDNIPHLRWSTARTFPKHFHAGDQLTVRDSYIPDDPEAGVIEFLAFARQSIGFVAGDTAPDDNQR